MSSTVELVVLDVNETLSDLEPLRTRLTDSGAPGHLLETRFASTLRDGFGLAAAQRPGRSPRSARRCCGGCSPACS